MIRPLGNRILIRPEETKDRTELGIIIPEQANNPLYLTGIIEVVGTRVQLDVKKGDHVAFAKVYDEVTQDKETFYLVEEPFLIAVYE